MKSAELLLADMRKHQLGLELRAHNQFRLFKELIPVIKELPEELSYVCGLYFTAYLDNDEDVRRVCADVRKVLGVKTSDKELERVTGKISYVTEGRGIKVKVYGGDLPSNCTLIKKSNSYITYEMECKND